MCLCVSAPPTSHPGTLCCRAFSLAEDPALRAAPWLRRAERCDGPAMGCSPSAFVANAVRAGGPDTTGSKCQEDRRSKSDSRKSSCRQDDLGSFVSSASNPEDARHDSFGKKTFGKKDRRNTSDKMRLQKRRNSNDKKAAGRQPAESRRKDTPAAFSNFGSMGCRKTPQRTSSQIEFFRMLDEKIAQGRDYESDTDRPIRSHSAESHKFLDAEHTDFLCQTTARSQSVS